MDFYFASTIYDYYFFNIFLLRNTQAELETSSFAYERWLGALEEYMLIMEADSWIKVTRAITSATGRPALLCG